MRSEILLIIGGMALATYLTRVGSLIILRYSRVSGHALTWLKHVPTAILTALIVPALLLPRGVPDFTLNNYYLLAGIAAAVAAYRSRSIVLTMGVGFSILFILKYLAH